MQDFNVVLLANFHKELPMLRCATLNGNFKQKLAEKTTSEILHKDLVLNRQN